MGFCVDGSSDFRVEGKVQTKDLAVWQCQNSSRCGMNEWKGTNVIGKWLKIAEELNMNRETERLWPKNWSWRVCVKIVLIRLRKRPNMDKHVDSGSWLCAFIKTTFSNWPKNKYQCWNIHCNALIWFHLSQIKNLQLK